MSRNQLQASINSAIIDLYDIVLIFWFNIQQFLSGWKLNGTKLYMLLSFKFEWEEYKSFSKRWIFAWLVCAVWSSTYIKIIQASIFFKFKFVLGRVIVTIIQLLYRNFIGEYTCGHISDVEPYMYSVFAAASWPLIDWTLDFKIIHSARKIVVLNHNFPPLILKLRDIYIENIRVSHMGGFKRKGKLVLNWGRGGVTSKGPLQWWKWNMHMRSWKVPKNFWQL